MLDGLPKEIIELRKHTRVVRRKKTLFFFNPMGSI